jgi:hypothetical protein
MAFLRALSQTVPEAWTLQEEHEQNLANHQLDLVLEDKLEDQADFESEELSFAQELTQMPAFSADKDMVAATCHLQRKCARQNLATAHI